MPERTSGLDQFRAIVAGEVGKSLPYLANKYETTGQYMRAEIVRAQIVARAWERSGRLPGRIRFGYGPLYCAPYIYNTTGGQECLTS